MPERDSKKIEEQNHRETRRSRPDYSRRSSRLHRENQSGAQSPITPEVAEWRRCRPDSFVTPPSKTKKTKYGVLESGGGKYTESNSGKPKTGLRRSARVQSRANFSSPDLRKQNVKEKRQTRSSVGGCRQVKGLEKSGEGFRRSERLKGGANVGKSKQDPYPRKKEVPEKRVTRGSIRINEVIEISDSDSVEDSDESFLIVPKVRKSKNGVDQIKKSLGKPEKKATGICRKTDAKRPINASNTNQRKAVVPDEVEVKGDNEISKKDTSKKDVEDCGVMKRNGEQNCIRKAQIGEKRKRGEVEEECETSQGWSKEQEAFLQRAYFTAKPTPQFWKKVARMVPGKSAEECFDKIHSDHLTPPQPKTRSRAKIKEPSPLSFSASNLLSPAEKKGKKLSSRRKAILAQKTVRQILQKQQNEDQDYSADLFDVLEPTINPSPIILEEGRTFTSPALSKTSSFLAACKPVSSSSQRKHLSRISSSEKATFSSPPVLKQIKNKALHEKYIDQLHCRDAKRKAEALRNSRNNWDQIDGKVNHLKQDTVKAAKDALVSDAQDAISQFRSLQCIIDGDDDDDDGGKSCNDEDEDEDGNGL